MSGRAGDAAVVAASFTRISVLVRAGGLGVVPWHLVCYTIPGVLIRGQIGPRPQGRVPQRRLECGMPGLFVVIGLAMGWIALRAWSVSRLTGLANALFGSRQRLRMQMRSGWKASAI